MFPHMGIPEFMLILVIAIIFIKPEDWPRFLRQIGRWYGQLQRYMNDFRDFSQDTYHQITAMDDEEEEAERQRIREKVRKKQAAEKTEPDSVVDPEEPIDYDDAYDDGPENEDDAEIPEDDNENNTAAEEKKKRDAEALEHHNEGLGSMPRGKKLPE